MKQTFIKLASLYLFLFCGVEVYSQVTFGHNSPPVPGALVQLKETNNENGTQPNSTRGLLMPRLPLRLKKLPSGNNNVLSTINQTSYGTWDNSSHIGLVIYNTETIKEQNLCPGLYVWKGTEWEELGVPCYTGINLNLNLDLSGLKNNTHIFASGYPGGSAPGSLIKELSINANWTPTDAILNIENISNGTNPGPLTFSSNPITIPTGGSGNIKFYPDPMTEAELNIVSGNPFLKKESIININLKRSPSDPAGAETSTTQSIILQQVNKALLLSQDNLTYTNQSFIIDRGSSTTQATINFSVRSNAEWIIETLPTTNSPISNIRIDNSPKNTGGQELNDGNPLALSTPLSLDFTAHGANARYSFLTFKDKQDPKRFHDLTITFTQCLGARDISMLEYKNLWESLYGLINGVDEPNSNGDEKANKNKVQWHYDQDGNIFFSAIFGNKRWMINNLSAKKYDTEAGAGSLVIENSYKIQTTKPAWGYPIGLERTIPNSAGNDNPADASFYNQRPRVGILYNWRAVMANKTTEGVQGICPNGWHVPTKTETDALIREVTLNPTQYSTNNGSLSALTVKDACEALGSSKPGLSFSLLDGGFSLMIAGNFYNGWAQEMGKSGSLWTSTQFSTTAAFAAFVNSDPDNQVLQAVNFTKTGGQAVRCVKN